MEISALNAEFDRLQSVTKEHKTDQSIGISDFGEYFELSLFFSKHSKLTRYNLFFSFISKSKCQSFERNTDWHIFGVFCAIDR